MFQDNKDHGANMGPTWVLSAAGGPQVNHVNLAIRVIVVQAVGTGFPQISPATFLPFQEQFTDQLAV